MTAPTALCGRGVPLLVPPREHMRDRARGHGRRTLRALTAFALAWASAAAGACEPEIGAPCDADTEYVEQVLAPAREGGGNALVQDVRMDACSQGLCGSVRSADEGGRASRGFCTARCESDADCAGAGDGFACTRLIFFGPLACRDFDDQRDCLTETDASGAPTFSRAPLRYCAAPPSVLEARDVAWGRSPAE